MREKFVMYRKHCSLTNFFVRALASVIVVITPIDMINSAGANIESALTIAGEEVVKELEWGKVVFHSKDLMNFKETNNVEVVLSHSVPIKNLLRQLQLAVEKEFPRATVTNRIEARLSGKGFKIKPIVPEIQAFSSEGMAQWSWDLTAIDGGLQNLNLTISVILIIAHRDAPFVVWDYDQPVNIEITSTQIVTDFFIKHLKWLTVIIMLPVVGFLMTRHRKRKHQIR